MHDCWRPVDGYDGNYLVSRSGDVFSVRRNKTLARVQAGRDYVRVNLYKDGHARHHLVHRLVAAAFLGPIPRGYEVNHKDGDKTNCNAENLEIVTRDENRKHAQRCGLLKRGEENARAKLTEADVREIRRSRDEGTSVRELAKRFDLTTQAIYGICGRKTWRHVE
jgi:hypothetical protein